MMKNIFYFTLKALFVLETFQFSFWIFGHVEKWRNKKAKVNFEIYDVTNWTTNNFDTYIARYLKK